MMFALLSLLMTAPADACLWDTDTLAFEQIGMPGVVEVLTGRFDRPPVALTRARLAVALDRLGRHSAAIAMMTAKSGALERSGDDATHRYQMLANQGTFYAHRWLAGGANREDAGDLGRAITLIEAAIALNPQAHFGREAVQLRVLVWLRDAQPLQAADDLWKQPGILGFEDWTGQTITAVSRGEVDPTLADTIEGLTGLIVMGGAWESPDIHLALSRALHASGQSTLGWMARLRTVELLRAGKTLQQPTQTTTVQLTDTLLEESLQIARDAAAVEASFKTLRAEAESRRTAREGFVIARLAEGHPPDATIWQGAPE